MGHSSSSLKVAVEDEAKATELLAEGLALFSMALGRERERGWRDGGREAGAGFFGSPGWKNSPVPDAIGFLPVTHPRSSLPGQATG